MNGDSPTEWSTCFYIFLERSKGNPSNSKGEGASLVYGLSCWYWLPNPDLNLKCKAMTLLGAGDAYLHLGPNRIERETGIHPR